MEQVYSGICVGITKLELMWNSQNTPDISGSLVDNSSIVSSMDKFEGVLTVPTSNSLAQNQPNT